MIEYDPHHWRSHLLDLRGSMVREIFARVFTSVVWAAVVVTVIRYVDIGYSGAVVIDEDPSSLHSADSRTHKEIPLLLDLDHLTMPLTAHTLVGVALSLLLVFRTNSSYDRFWEGRKLWGSIVNETRNLARLASVHLAGDANLRNQVIRWTIAFPYSCMYKLRKGASLGEVQCRLGADEADEACKAEHVPLDVTRRITSLLRIAKERGLISDYVMCQMDQNVQLLVDFIGGCERIHKTPMPFAYMVHLRRAIILYTFSLPFALYRDFGWATIVVTFFVSYIFYGIEEIGVTIEDPFEGEDNDLPLDDICRTIDKNLSSLIGDVPPPIPAKVSPATLSDAAVLNR